MAVFLTVIYVERWQQAWSGSVCTRQDFPGEVVSAWGRCRGEGRAQHGMEIDARYHWKVTHLLFHKDSIFFLILKFCIWKHSMTESIYIHLQCFWYDTVFNTSTVFCKRFCFVRQKQTPLDKKIQLRHNFVVIFLLNEKTEKVQKWAGSAIVSENHILPWGKAFGWLEFDYWSISDSSISLKILL